MTENGTDWRLVAAEEARQRNKAEEALVEMRRFLFDYFHLLGPDPLENINVVVRTLGKVLGSDVALYNRLENGILKTWSIDNEPAVPDIPLLPVFRGYEGIGFRKLFGAIA